MKKLLTVFWLVSMGFASISEAAPQYFNGKVERIEACKSNGGTVDFPVFSRHHLIPKSTPFQI